MVYAVAMKTIEHFESALGRKALWAPRMRSDSGLQHDQYVRQLRIYPPAVRAANAFYSPPRKALLLGYFASSPTFETLPGRLIFAALSSDIVAHETTHALRDGLHRFLLDPSNDDVLAFHEAFADIVALFQHFSMPELLRHAISTTRGDLRLSEAAKHPSGVTTADVLPWARHLNALALSLLARPIAPVGKNFHSNRVPNAPGRWRAKVGRHPRWRPSTWFRPVAVLWRSHARLASNPQSWTMYE
jgi:hypothetical protein